MFTRDWKLKLIPFRNDEQPRQAQVLRLSGSRRPNQTAPEQVGWDVRLERLSEIIESLEPERRPGQLSPTRFAVCKSSPPVRLNLQLQKRTKDDTAGSEFL